MSRELKYGIFGAVFAAALLVPGHAQQSSSSSRPPADPNEKICEDITSVGSRLATKRTCATRAEWEAKRKLEREAVDQLQRGPGPGCSLTPVHNGVATC
jgi:hypothetical protein